MTLRPHSLLIDTGETYAECPALFDVTDENAWVVSFHIGGWTGDRDEAISMTGKAHVEAQEAAAFAAWDADQREEAMFGERHDYAAE